MSIIVMQGVLFVSSDFQWFWFNEDKGYTVIITVAATVVCLLFLACFAFIGRLFGAKPQFGLATLLLLVVVVAIPFAWLAHEVTQAQQQRAALEACRGSLNGYRYSLRGYSPRFFSPYVSEQLESILGKDFFLENLSVALTDMQAEDVEPLNRIRNLRSLDLFDGDDSQLAHLEKVTNLRGLGLIRIPLTDDGIDRLTRLTRLQELSFSETALSDEILSHVARLPELRSLDLSDTQVTDAGMKELRKLSQLQELDLSYRPITDEGLEKLKGHPRLEWLKLYGTQVTDAGVKALQESLPNCQIDR